MIPFKKIFKFLLKANLKSIYFNFRYLPYSQAIKFPILVSKNVVFKKMGGKVFLDSDTVNTAMIQIGYEGVGIFDKKYSRSIWEVSGSVIFKGNAIIGHGSKISVGATGKLILGPNFIITAESSIVTFSKIQFGYNCLLSWDILIMDTDFHEIKDEVGTIINSPREIIFGNNIWVGCRTLILKGSIIPDNIVIAANSTVTTNLGQQSCIYAGSPARKIREQISWNV